MASTSPSISPSYSPSISPSYSPSLSPSISPSVSPSPADLIYPPTQNGLQKTLGAELVASYTTSATLSNTTGLQNKKGLFVVDRIDTSGAEKDASLREYISFEGVSGSTVTTLVRGLGGTTDQAHAVGAVVEFVMDVVQQQAVIDTLLVEHGTDGTHKQSIVVTIAGTQTITGDKTLSGTTTFSTTPKTDAIAEKTSGAGVTIDGLLIKDGSVSGLNTDGWETSSDTWVYASNDDPTFTATISGVDKTTTYYAGMRVKLTQSTGGTKYFIITKVAFSTNTTITLYGGSDYNLENETISSPYYSSAKAPAGFPCDPLKWSEETKNTSNYTQSTPTASTYYNLNSGLSLSIPIGCWKVTYSCAPYVADSSTIATIRTTLSTANNSESDADFSIQTLQQVGSASQIMISQHHMEKYLNLTSKTIYYLNAMTDQSGVDSIQMRGDYGYTIIRAICAYL
jgi:hypothetical protein